MAATVGVILSGSGVYDGTEITEAVSVMIALSKRDTTPRFFAPDIPQMHVIDHTTGASSESEIRNVLTESARIARGNIQPLAKARVADLDALVFPGGFGAAKNLSDFAIKGADCTVHPELARLCTEMHAAKKPIGFACISPVIAAKLFKGEVTIGNDPDTAAAIEQMGATHRNADRTEIVIDEANRIVTTPCYMYGDSTAWHIFQGADAMVEAVLKFIR